MFLQVWSHHEPTQVATPGASVLVPSRVARVEVILRAQGHVQQLGLGEEKVGHHLATPWVGSLGAWSTLGWCATLAG